MLALGVLSRTQKPVSRKALAAGNSVTEPAASALRLTKAAVFRQRSLSWFAARKPVHTSQMGQAPISYAEGYFEDGTSIGASPICSAFGQSSREPFSRWFLMTNRVRRSGFPSVAGSLADIAFRRRAESAAGLRRLRCSPDVQSVA